MGDGYLFPGLVYVSPQATTYMGRHGELLSWYEYELPKIARRYRVMNRNVWWNPPALVRIEAFDDRAAVDALVRSTENR